MRKRQLDRAVLGIFSMNGAAPKFIICQVATIRALGEFPIKRELERIEAATGKQRSAA